MPARAREGWRALRNDPVIAEVFPACATLALAVGVFAVSFGVGSVAAGASVTQTCLLSLLVFTGASQFSAVSVIGAGGSTASALGGALLLAARNGVYGLTLARLIPGRLSVRLVAAQFTIDETTAMAAVQQDPRAARAAFWITGVSLYVCWNIGTLIGALAGSAIDPQDFGLDAAFPAAYVAMVLPLLRDRRGRLAGLLGAAICVALVPFTPVGVPILCAALAVLVGLRAPGPGDSEEVPAVDGAPA